ncbi:MULTISPECIES: hypothetical protein [unclassified Acidovorax]|uniref:hypothetical protein n=1 Tax=unclassified Acidovorax TaxID=2684926 RepID=UPI000C17A9FC|nr:MULTISPECIES: hypothetical protein [unclassified Acidovorax]PIF20563.1 hypothetical protein CLU87_4545 [Acidovorax sp. 59]PKW00414.1 hypothetical protein CLU89_0017 [Acidovorax sp. 30]
MAALPSGVSPILAPPGYAMTDTAHTQLTTFTQALQAFERGDHTAATLSTLAREQTTLLAALPPRYSDVLLNLLDRLESSALFSEESCSFSQKDLVANLTMWAEKAQGTLNAS